MLNRRAGVCGRYDSFCEEEGHSETKLRASVWTEASPTASRRMCGRTRGRRTIACLGGLGTAFPFDLEGRSRPVAQAHLELNSPASASECRNDIMPETGTAFKECDGGYFSDKGNRSDAGGQAGRAPWVGSQSLLKATFTIPSLKGHLSHRGEK